MPEQHWGGGLGGLIDLNPCPAFCFDEPANGLELGSTVQLRQPRSSKPDPLQRQFKTNLQPGPVWRGGNPTRYQTRLSQ